MSRPRSRTSTYTRIDSSSYASVGAGTPSRASLSKRGVRRRLVLTVLLLAFVLATSWYVRRRGIQSKTQRVIELNMATHPPVIERGLVMAKTPHDDISWVLDLTPTWTPYIYTSTSPPEPGYHTLPLLRGREATAYLTFITTHYAHLPSLVAFTHAAPTQWHNDILGPHTSTLLSSLNTSTITKLGYANLRCTLEPGCPLALLPLAPTEHDILTNSPRAHFAEIYAHLFALKDTSLVPAAIGNVCCGQFVVTAERIRQRPRADYERMRQWIVDSEDLVDSFGVGWVFEKLWHIIFGMEATHCPSFKQCRCDLFGWCGATVPDEYRDIVKSAHPWFGSKLGNVFGNANAVRADDDLD